MYGTLFVMDSSALHVVYMNVLISAYLISWVFRDGNLDAKLKFTAMMSEAWLPCQPLPCGLRILSMYFCLKTRSNYTFCAFPRGNQPLIDALATSAQHWACPGRSEHAKVQSTGSWHARPDGA